MYHHNEVDQGFENAQQSVKRSVFILQGSHKRSKMEHLNDSQQLEQIRDTDGIICLMIQTLN